MSNLMLLVIIATAVIVAGYVLSITRIDFTRHLIAVKNQRNSSKEIL
ncbi:MAG: hypothetical protein JKY50_03260 [Oleispira sp.]|nr:hypothetical protein [Oleispira sp.]MBL4881631.1 hypothetical protein [Oleispira sp.]